LAGTANRRHWELEMSDPLFRHFRCALREAATGHQTKMDSLGFVLPSVLNKGGLANVEFARRLFSLQRLLVPFDFVVSHDNHYLRAGLRFGSQEIARIARGQRSLTTLKNCHSLSI
jgi:hypothetical protein